MLAPQKRRFETPKCVPLRLAAMCLWTQRSKGDHHLWQTPSHFQPDMQFWSSSIWAPNPTEVFIWRDHSWTLHQGFLKTSSKGHGRKFVKGGLSFHVWPIHTSTMTEIQMKRKRPVRIQNEQQWVGEKWEMIFFFKRKCLSLRSPEERKTLAQK